MTAMNIKPLSIATTPVPAFAERVVGDLGLADQYFRRAGSAIRVDDMQPSLTFARRGAELLSERASQFDSAYLPVPDKSHAALQGVASSAARTVFDTVHALETQPASASASISAETAQLFRSTLSDASQAAANTGAHVLRYGNDLQFNAAP